MKFFLHSIAVARGMNESEGSCSRRLLSEILLQFNITEDEEENCLENLNFNSYDNNENSTNNRNKYENSRLRGNVVVIAATNRLEDMDEAIIRRFDSKVFIGNWKLHHL
jgi:SpoVK/Ycf46/Vps4 family AAA+-type ATPase